MATGFDPPNNYVPRFAKDLACLKEILLHVIWCENYTIILTLVTPQEHKYIQQKIENFQKSTILLDEKVAFCKLTMLFSEFVYLFRYFNKNIEI